MTQLQYILLMAAIAVIALLGMGLAWRARARRDATMTAPDAALSGAELVSFPRVSYVSTTPVGAPLQRLSVPALRYKGYAAVTVHQDGVELAITGEQPVRIAAADLLGTAAASGRIGKAVERDGLALMLWRIADRTAPAGSREVESSFRFSHPAEQLRFADALTAITPNQTPTNATQEDA